MALSAHWKSCGGLVAAALVGMTIGRMSGSIDTKPVLRDLKLQAMASHGSDNFAIATGPIDDEVEGLFTLDFLTSELQCSVINPGTFARGGFFQTNVAKDLAPEKGKKPTYLIATGVITAKGGAAGGARPAGCICYVVDANTTEAAAYTFAWDRGAAAAGAPQIGKLTLVYKWKVRTL